MLFNYLKYQPNLFLHKILYKANWKKLSVSAEQELVEFLSEEIAAEQKLQKIKTIPTEVEGFKVKLEGAEVSLTKTVGDET